MAKKEYLKKILDADKASQIPSIKQIEKLYAEVLFKAILNQSNIYVDNDPLTQNKFRSFMIDFIVPIADKIDPKSIINISIDKRQDGKYNMSAKLSEKGLVKALTADVDELTAIKSFISGGKGSRDDIVKFMKENKIIQNLIYYQGSSVYRYMGEKNAQRTINFVADTRKGINPSRDIINDMPDKLVDSILSSMKEKQMLILIKQLYKEIPTHTSRLVSKVSETLDKIQKIEKGKIFGKLKLTANQGWHISAENSYDIVSSSLENYVTAVDNYKGRSRS